MQSEVAKDFFSRRWRWNEVCLWRNSLATLSSFEIANEFKNFSRLKVGGVVIQNRNENISACCAFVEYEDFFFGVQDAVKAST